MRQPTSWRSTSSTSNVLIIAARRAAHRAVQAEHRNAVLRIREIRRLDHVVLLVAAQAVLRPERRRELDVGQRRQRVERVREIARHRRGMREQRDALAAQALAQRARSEQPIQTELHRALPSSNAVNPAASWKSGLLARVPQREVRAAARAVLDDGRQADAPRPWCVGERAEFYGGRHTELVGRLPRRRSTAACASASGRMPCR